MLSTVERNGLPTEKILGYASELRRLHHIQSAAVEPEVDPTFARAICPKGMVNVTAGIRLYSNSRNYNQNGRKCDWSFNTACDVKFYVTYSWALRSGQTEYGINLENSLWYIVLFCCFEMIIGSTTRSMASSRVQRLFRSTLSICTRLKPVHWPAHTLGLAFEP